MKLLALVTLYYPPAHITDNLLTYAEDVDGLFVWDNTPGGSNYQFLLLYISCPLETVNARYDTNVVIKLTSSYNFKFPCRNSAAIWLRPGIGRVAACGKSSSKQSAGLMSG